MAEGRMNEAWDHTSAILAYLINTMPFKKSKKIVSPEQMHPFVLKRKKESVSRRLSREESIKRLNQIWGVS